MPRFFVSPEEIDLEAGTARITGDDAHHIARSLRMAEGDGIVLCDGQGRDYQCTLARIRDDRVDCAVLSSAPSLTEPPYRAVLYQALVKGELFEVAVQKSVEYGACAIVPFESSRCVVKSREGGSENKLTRLRRIAAEAAKQSGRGIIPEVAEGMTFDRMLAEAARADLPLFCYEEEDRCRLGTLLEELSARVGEGRPSVSVVVGPEGGFSPEEAEKARAAGLCCVSLGPRILRTESAAPFVLAALSAFCELR